jgi:hypothetical protein
MLARFHPLRRSLVQSRTWACAAARFRVVSVRSLATSAPVSDAPSAKKIRVYTRTGDAGTVCVPSRLRLLGGYFMFPASFVPD